MTVLVRRVSVVGGEGVQAHAEGTTKGGRQASQVVIWKATYWWDNFQDYAKMTVRGSSTKNKTETKVTMVPGREYGQRWCLFPVCSLTNQERGPAWGLTSGRGTQEINICCCINVSRPPIFLILEELASSSAWGRHSSAGSPLLCLSSCTHQLSANREKRSYSSDHWKGSKWTLPVRPTTWRMQASAVLSAAAHLENRDPWRSLWNVYLPRRLWQRKKVLPFFFLESKSPHTGDERKSQI